MTDSGQTDSGQTDSAQTRTEQSAAGEATSPPTLRILAGLPTPEEVAAVTVALLSGGGGDEPAAAPQSAVGGWADRQSLQRVPTRPGPRAWRAQAR